MMSSFLYTQTTIAHSVNLHLFASADGIACGNVKGPVSPNVTGPGDISEIRTALPLAKAFAYAIRVANRNDVEIVVSGDSSLWDQRWGCLGTPSGQA